MTDARSRYAANSCSSSLTESQYENGNRWRASRAGILITLMTGRRHFRRRPRRVAPRTGVGDNGSMPESRRVAVR